MNLNLSGTYTDLYQLTMAQAYFDDGLKDMPVVFDYFFRKTPFNGGYVIFAGLAEVLEGLENFKFTEEDLSYLYKRGFHKAFLKYLSDFRFKGRVYAPKEGEVVFPTAPVMRIEGNSIEVQLVETFILNITNFQSLIATKASRMRLVAKDKILSEFGLRRAQAFGGVAASRAAIIGGFDSTSNVYAAIKYGMPSEGTMAHSYIQLYGDDLTAFRKFSIAHPTNTTLLVDTFDTLKSGVPSAIIVAKEMEQRGEKLRAIRLDSGDLAFLSIRARKMLDEAGLHDVKIATSNQLDEYVIRSLDQQGAKVDIFGIGTALVTGKPDAALDGVYKLAMADGNPRIKVSENIQKTTLPAKKQLHRLFHKDGSFLGVDAITLIEEKEIGLLIHPFEAHKTKPCDNLKATPLLKLVMEGGD